MLSLVRLRLRCFSSLFIFVLMFGYPLPTAWASLAPFWIDVDAISIAERSNENNQSGKTALNATLQFRCTHSVQLPRNRTLNPLGKHLGLRANIPHRVRAHNVPRDVFTTIREHLGLRTDIQRRKGTI